MSKTFCEQVKLKPVETDSVVSLLDESSCNTVAAADHSGVIPWLADIRHNVDINTLLHAFSS